MKTKDEILNIDINKIIEYENNPREHPRGQIKALAKSIKEFSFIDPVIIDENNVLLAGHGRIEAAKEAGMGKVKAVKVTHLSEEQKTWKDG